MNGSPLKQSQEHLKPALMETFHAFGLRQNVANRIAYIYFIKLKYKRKGSEAATIWE